MKLNRNTLLLIIISIITFKGFSQKKETSPAVREALKNVLKEQNKGVSDDEESKQTITSTRVLTFDEFYKLASLTDSELNEEVTAYLDGWQFVQAKDETTTGGTSVMYKNNGTRIDNIQVLIQHLKGDVQSGINVVSLELIVYDFSYIEKFISRLKDYNFILKSKDENNYKFSDTKNLIMIEKRTVNDKILYKIKIS